MKKIRFTRSQGQSASGFTRTDAITALAALMLLLFIFSSALANSKNHAGRTICRNNLRQMANASIMYAADNAEYMAYPNWGNSAAGWLYTPVNGTPPRPGGYEKGLWFEYVRDTNAYLCPIDLESPYYKSRANQLSSYVMNGAVCGYGTSTSTAKITDPWSPECYLLYQPDESVGQPPIGAFAFNDASSYPDRNEGLGALHSVSTVDIATVGGNVRSVTTARVRNEQTAKAKSFAWWNPFSANGR